MVAELKPELWKHSLSFSVYDLWPLCEREPNGVFGFHHISYRVHTLTLSIVSYLYRPFIWDPDYSSSNKTQQFSSLNQENRKVGLFDWLFSASHQRTATEDSLAQVSITDSTPTLNQWRKDRVLTSPRGSIQTVEIIIHHCPLGGVLLRCQSSND